MGHILPSLTLNLQSLIHPSYFYTATCRLLSYMLLRMLVLKRQNSHCHIASNLVFGIDLKDIH